MTDDEADETVLSALNDLPFILGLAAIGLVAVGYFYCPDLTWLFE